MKSPILGVVTILGFFFIVIPSPSEGLTCWSCTNQMNSKCSEDTFSAAESITMLKTDCSIIFRNDGASCSKVVIKNRDTVSVTRGCVAKRLSDIQDGTCRTLGSQTTCLCQGDLCNGATRSQGLESGLTFLTFLLLVKTFLEHFRLI